MHTALPRVSVILPARNEERNIHAALLSLAALSYPALEIIVVDDHSDDNTAAQARAFARTYQGDKVIAVLQIHQEPPLGWMGKTFAADFAIQHSSGDVLLVCDVDVRHQPDSLHKTVTYLKETRQDILSRLPHFDIRSIGESPLLFQTFLLYLCSTISRLLGSRQSFGMGTYLMFTREFYVRSGGWRVHREYPDPFPLINYCIQHRGRFCFLADDGAITARMHTGARDTFVGLVRNTNFSLLPPLPAWLFTIYLVLFSTAVVCGAQGSIPALTLWVAMSGLFAAYLLQTHYPLLLVVFASLLSFLMPLYLILVTAVACLRTTFNKPILWRGRKLFPTRHNFE